MAPNTSSPRAVRPPTSQLAADILAVGVPLRGLISGLEPKDVPLTWAPEVLAAFVEVQRLAESGRLLMLSRAAEAKEWQRSGFTTPEEWLAAQMGTTAGRARGDLETSEQLGDLDATSDAVRNGELSPEQAGAVAGGASVNPGAEADLLDTARQESLARTRREAERRKAEQRSEQDKAERERQVRERRRARFWYADGEGHMEVRGPVAELKHLEQFIQRQVDRMFRSNRAPEQRGSRANYAFDALVDLADARASAGRPGSRVPATRLTMIRVDLAALRRGSVTTGEVCEIGGIAVSVAELRRVLGDSVLQLVLTNGEAVIDIVNLNRKPSVAQKLAKLFTDSRCGVQGCDKTVVLEFDHRVDWAGSRVTELDNLDLFCDHHHDLKTYEKWQLVPGSGRRPMVPPTDPRHPARRRDEPSKADASVSDLAERAARIGRAEAERRTRRGGQDSLFDTG